MVRISLLDRRYRVNLLPWVALVTLLDIIRRFLNKKKATAAIGQFRISIEVLTGYVGIIDRELLVSIEVFVRQCFSVIQARAQISSTPCYPRPGNATTDRAQFRATNDVKVSKTDLSSMPCTLRAKPIT